MALKPEFKEPTGSLLTELLELSAVAEVCRKAFDDANYMPEDFPSSAVRSILISLEQLHLGSARGCQGPLEYARSRLPAIRRDYFLIENDAEERVASLDRGSYLDQCLRDTIASVATALDEYRHFYTSTSDEEIVEADSTYVLSTQDGEKLLSESTNLDSYVEGKIGENNSFTEIVESKRVERLLYDIKNVNLTARGDIGYGRIVIRWTRRLISQFKRYPSMIKYVAQSVRDVVVASEPLRIRWRDFWSDLEDFGAQQILRTADALEDTADKIESRRRQPARGDAGGVESDSKNISQWVENFVLERTQDSPFISFSYIASAIQYHFNEKPKDVAKKSGFKKPFDIVVDNSNLDVVKRSNNVYVFHIVNRGVALKKIRSDNNNNMKRLKELILMLNETDEDDTIAVYRRRKMGVLEYISDSFYVPYSYKVRDIQQFPDDCRNFTNGESRFLDYI